jgi:ribonuclease P protein component
VRREERLRSRPDFERLFERGARVERGAFVLLWIREPGPHAVAFAAGRRLGGSVVRNRARRRLREAYRQARAGLPLGGVRVCFVARPATLRTSFRDVLAQIREALYAIARR